ncbi:MAG: phosphate ABC transporter substrate-binding protein PstS [Thermodesulfobacteria bacterium]|nr:phosphate ABC transporter substrate-binding protein PstS [Thermodesulfobacteriota bacterium]
MDQIKRLIIYFVSFFVLLISVNIGFSFELIGTGSTFVQPIIQAWAYRYYRLTKVQVVYEGIGSGGGIRQAESKTVDFGASDKPLKSKELRKYKLIQFPDIIGAVVIIYNIPKLQKVSLRLDNKAICGIYMGEIKRWDDPYLKKLNPEINLPHLNITVVRRSDGSGTTWLFTTYLSKACRAWRKKVGAGTSVNWPVGIGAKGNPGVTNYVKRTIGAIGYVEYTYAKQNGLPMAKLMNRDHTHFVSPCVRTMQAAASHAKWNSKKDFYIDLTYKPGWNSYPITGASFILLPLDNSHTKQVVRFFKWAYENGDTIAKQLNYIPLPRKLVKMIYHYWKTYGVYPGN